MIAACAVAIYFLVPGDAWKDAVYSVVGLGCVACVAAGIVRHAPADRWAWSALAGANACFVVGDGVTDVYDLVLHRALPYPSFADALYLAGYPLLIIAVTRLSRSTTPGGSRENRVDATIVAVGALALSWQLLIGPYAHDETSGTVGKLVTLAYPVMDIGVLFIVANSVLFATVRRASDTLIGLGLAAMLIADFAYDLLSLQGTYATGNPVDAGWLLGYVLLGAAALHPSMAGPDRAPVPSERSATARRLPLVALAGFVAPGILLAGTLSHRTVDVAVLAGTSVVLFGLVVLRVMWLLGRLGDQAATLRDQARSLQQALAGQMALEADLRHQAFHDDLTGLPNRALLHDRVGHALDASVRSPGTVAVLFCDLDGFKAVNDSLGHDVGDRLLVAISQRLVSAVRPGDTVARLGGDEFAVLMNDVEDPGVGIAVAGRAVSAVRQVTELEGRAMTVSISVGIAFADPGTSTDLLLSQADAAMYAAKADGKDRWHVFQSEMRTRIVKRMELRNALPGALQRGEFHLMYQARTTVPDQRLEGFEALVVWSHPVHGELGPADFLPLAEETGFAVPLGRWILDTACTAAATWPGRGETPLSVSVGVCGRQLEDEHFIDDVRTALAYSGIEPHRLTLEATEGVLVGSAGATVAGLRGLAELGVRLAITDFGTGYSSLGALRRIPAQCIKIDKSFVSPLPHDGAEGTGLIRAVIRLAHDLDWTTVADGVEHVSQVRALTALGCDSIQGGLVSPPLDPDGAVTFALEWGPVGVVDLS